MAWLSHASFAVGTHVVDQDSKISAEGDGRAEDLPQRTKSKPQQILRLPHSHSETNINWTMAIEDLAFVCVNVDKWRQAVADPLYDDFQRKNRTKVHWGALIQYEYTERWTSNTCEQIRKYDGLWHEQLRQFSAAGVRP